jgi:hypothetical protein
MFEEERLKERVYKPRLPALARNSAGAWIGEAIPGTPAERTQRRVSPRRPRDGVHIGLKRPERVVKRRTRPKAPNGALLRDVLWAKETEAHFQERVIKAAKALGFKYVYHTFDSRKSPSGFPDLVLIHPAKHRLLFVELKSQRGKLTWAQTLWRVALSELAGVEYYCWRPSDWDALVGVLRG